MRCRLTHLSLSLCAVLCAHSAFAKAPLTALPEPLSLPVALSIAADQEPAVIMAQAEALLVQAERQATEVRDNFQVRFEGGLVRREFNGREEDFNNAYLVLQQQLFDFGRTRLGLEAADAQLSAQLSLEQHARQVYRQRVIEAYYDVLIADMTARVENEQMAIEYVALDNAKDEQKVGKKSALDILELDDVYQRTNLRRTDAENAQRSTRAALSELLGFPKSLPSELDTPDTTPYQKRPLGEPKQLQEKAIQSNIELAAMAKQVSAAELKLQVADKMDAPRIDALGRTGSHSHVEDRYEGRWRYDLALTMPLVDGGVKASEVDRAKAALMKLRAQQSLLTRQIRQAVLDTSLKLSSMKTRETQVKTAGNYAEMYLDKSRTEYQYERKADLGDAMVRASRAELELLKLDRDRTVLWEQLQRLIGEQ